MKLLKSIKNALSKPTNKVDLKNNINPEIFNLLWFANGPYKNYDTNEHVETYNNGPITINIYNSSTIEPSAIYVDLPIKKPINIKEVSELSYFPNYKDLSSEQKWIYLNWLVNPYEPIDIGYVFIFYYGLERHLVLGNFDEAFDIIIKLRKAHDNNSFRSYSDNALVLSTILHNRPDKLKDFLNYTDTSGDSINTITYLLAKHTFKQSLDPENIIKFSRSVGFTNHRYIKNEYDLFKKVLNDTLIEMFGEPLFPLENFNLKNCNKSSVFFLANYSFESNQRSVSIPDLTDSDSFKDSLYSILSVTHEKVKKTLREIRKNKDNLPVSIE